MQDVARVRATVRQRIGQRPNADPGFFTVLFIASAATVICGYAICLLASFVG